jgi:hypothetical protein
MITQASIDSKGREGLMQIDPGRVSEKERNGGGTVMENCEQLVTSDISSAEKLISNYLTIQIHLFCACLRRVDLRFHAAKKGAGGDIRSEK